MLRVALTGGVGSGKSTAASMLRRLGAHVSQSDEVGRAMMQPGEPVFCAIVQHFGSAVLSASGGIDRAALAELAFQGGRLAELNALVHPPVITAQTRWMDEVGASDACAVAVVESALVFETVHGPAPVAEPSGAAAPWRTRFDRIIVIVAPVAVRLSRYLQRAGGGAQAAAADFDRRAAAQWTDEQKARCADIVIPNGGTLPELQEHMATLFLELRQEAADRAAEAM